MPKARRGSPAQPERNRARRPSAVAGLAASRGSGYANLNTAIFDAKGMHWFTGQSGVYGRLHPKTGEMKVFDAPRAGADRRGIRDARRHGVLRLAGSFIGKINADDTTTVIEPPTNARARARCVRFQGNLWVAEWNSGNLSRFEPKTGKWSAWAAPETSRTSTRFTSTIPTRYGSRVERAGHAAL